MRFEDRVRHWLIQSLLMLVLILAISACKSTAENVTQDADFQPKEKILIVGHRGAAGLRPENTLSAFTEACRLGVDAVELDVLLSADEKIVVHHDYTLKPELARNSDGQWLKQPSAPIKTLSLDEIKAYEIGRLKPSSRYSQRYPEQEPVDGERIPTLSEVIDVVKAECDPQTQLWVEIKTNPEKPDLTPAPEAVAEAVVGLLRREKLIGRVRILSFDWRSLAHVQEIAHDIPTVYLSLAGVRLNNIKPGQPGASPWLAGVDVDDFNGSIPRAIHAAGGKYWAPYYKHLSAMHLNQAHGLGMRVFVWTPDHRNDMLRLIEMGVDGIITNRPDILKSIVKE
ncbi:MAG: glycerophosphodiester phosphodiesterase [Desulfobacterales bacterium]|jgi:glycerophosphoryl diester phosphodiesterase